MTSAQAMWDGRMTRPEKEEGELRAEVVRQERRGKKMSVRDIVSLTITAKNKKLILTKSKKYGVQMSQQQDICL